MKTALYERHVGAGAKIIDFCGWEMPIQYTGTIQEHQTVRQKVGLFDISHMGRIDIKGKDAEAFLDYLSTNTISGRPLFSATYTVWNHPDGGCVDDLIVYKQTPEMFFVVVNAANRQKDLSHLQKYAASFDVEIFERFNDGILALQGPNAIPLILEIFPSAIILQPMNFISLPYNGEEVIISRTGYTGSDGVEIYASSSSTIDLWDRLTILGKPYGLLPIGLGARDTLRLEMGYALYGHELSDTISANESVSAWTVKLKKKDFLGKKFLENLQKNPKKRSEYGIILIEQGIAREGCEIFQDEVLIGKVTSGTYSPTLSKAIALILVQGSLKEGEIVEVQIRQKRVKAEVVKLPFWK